MAEPIRPARAANIFDVAKLAGVSHQTVSRVLNDVPNVRPATRARVEYAIAQLRYSPSPAARALVTKRTRTIGLVTPGSIQYGPTSIATHFNFAARATRYNVDAVSSPEADVVAARAAVEALLRQRVDALVLIVVDVEVLESIRSLELGIPLVAAAATPRHSPMLVSIDQYRGARSAVRHLVELGHDRVLHLAGHDRSPDAVERVRGWRDELAAHGLEAVEPEYGDWSATSGYEIGGGWDIRRGDGIFAGNDHMAMALIAALRARGFRVPSDVSIVGFDDVPEAPYVYPALTTVRQDFAALGELIMQKVLLAVEEPDAVTAGTPLPTRLIVRESTRLRMTEAPD